MNYNQLVEIVKNKGCTLFWSEEFFKKNYKTKKSNIEIISNCGHNTIVQVSNLIYKNTGILCKKCGFEKQSKSKKGIINDTNIIEYETIKLLETYCKFKFKILVEGTLADIAIQPLDENFDIWLPIQIKTTKSLSHGIYSFDIKNKYKNMYVLLFCIDDQRIWILNGNDINIKRINIGHHTSIYNIYEVKLCTLHETLLNKYYNSIDFKKPLLELNIPISLQSQREQEFKEYRELLLVNLKFTYSEINNRVFDCIINNIYKIQDKVITIYQKKCKNKKNLYMVHLCRHNNDGNIMYKLGDNDFYWLSLPDKTGAYIIPENILFEKNIISNKNECKFILSLYPYHSSNQLTKIKTSWLNDYLYFYDKDIEKINKLFIPNDKNNVIINDFIPNILSKKKYILKENSNKLIKIIVSQIFKNVILNNKNKIYECIECKKQLNKSGIIRCLECSRLNSRKVKRPSYEQLLNDLTTLNYTQVGKLYNVSDNCIRKWIKYYNVNGI